MTSLERVLTALGHREPDRVPLFLLLTMHGAKELGLSIREYYSRGENVAEGQVRLRRKYGHDCLYPFFYAPLEIEAWGGEVIFRDDGPPNSGEPFISSPRQISHLEPPRVRDAKCLSKVLQGIRLLKERVGDQAPIIGVVMSPFSLPVMQMGFEGYLDLMMTRPRLLHRLLRLNEAFAVEWANAQLAAGATAICYFDPLSSPSMVPRDLFLKTGYRVARRTLPAIRGAIAVHLASGRSLPIIDDVIRAGAAVVGTSSVEDLAEVKAACAGRMTVLGNLNGIEMCRWCPAEAEEAVRNAIAKAAAGGGFILSDNHGEIPFQVGDDVLAAIAEATRRHGTYPIGE